MSSKHQPQEISDQELVNETGKTWNQWFSEMERKNFDQLSVLDMSNELVLKYAMDEPVARLVALRYCQHIGHCSPTTTTSVFEVSVSKTFNYPLDEVYGRATDWFEAENRMSLQQRINHKRLNCKWLSDNSNIDVKFLPKGQTKTKMVVQHDKLESETDVEIMRNFWKRSLPNMIETL